MATEKQKLGDLGEALVAKHIDCLKCKKEGTLKRLPANFKSVDLICDFCGWLAQVKAKSVSDKSVLPKTILGASWPVQQRRMEAGIYFPLFIVLIDKERRHAIYYLSADLQVRDMFVPRKPLSSSARRSGWQGFIYDLSKLDAGGIVRLK